MSGYWYTYSFIQTVVLCDSPLGDTCIYFYFAHINNPSSYHCLAHTHPISIVHAYMVLSSSRWLHIAPYHLYAHMYTRHAAYLFLSPPPPPPPPCAIVYILPWQPKYEGHAVAEHGIGIQHNENIINLGISLRMQHLQSVSKINVQVQHFKPITITTVLQIFTNNILSNSAACRKVFFQTSSRSAGTRG